MMKVLALAAVSALLAGCAQTSEWAWLHPPGAVQADSRPRQFSFQWQIRGEPSLAPLQVFDDGERTWMQYPTGQVAPAFFERTRHGDRVLAPMRDGEYLVLQGVPAHLLMRGGHLTAEALRLEDTQAPTGLAAAEAVTPPLERQSGGVAMGEVPLLEDLPTTAAIALPAATPLPIAHATVVPPPAAPLPPAAPAPVRVVSAFTASPADINIRKALGRWAREADWVFEAEHWAVDVDIPLAGSATFGDGFRPAVRALLAATELGERPLQPCFYANRVLRVVPLAQRCDRTIRPGMQS